MKWLEPPAKPSNWPTAVNWFVGLFIVARSLANERDDECMNKFDCQMRKREEWNKSSQVVIGRSVSAKMRRENDVSKFLWKGGPSQPGREVIISFGVFVFVIMSPDLECLLACSLGVCLGAMTVIILKKGPLVHSRCKFDEPGSQNESKNQINKFCVRASQTRLSSARLGFVVDLLHFGGWAVAGGR